MEHRVDENGHGELKPTEGAAPLTRRNFLRLGLGALSVLTILETGGAGLLFLAPRPVEGEFGGKVKTGPAADFPNGSVTEFPDGRFFLVRTEDGGFLAVYRKCTHLGCAVSWDAHTGRFSCPCHGSHFDLSGSVQNPPAPRALDTFDVMIEDGQVVVDTARARSRDRFAPEQLVYARAE